MSKKPKPASITEIEVKKCSLCKHFYMKPCNGKDKLCQNAVFVRSNGTIDVSRMTATEREKFRKSGKQVPNIEPNIHKPKRKRVKL